jgi:opine dehydrogenase
VETRWLTEDIPFGLATWALLGDRLGVETPVIDALVTLASATLGRDFRAETRDLDEIGLSRFEVDQLRGIAAGIGA